MQDTSVDFDGMTQRLEAAGRRVRDSYEVWQTDLKERDELVVDALDQGMRQSSVAAAVGVSQQRVGRLTLPRSD